MQDHDNLSRPAVSEDLPFLRRCFLDAMRDSITACWGRWDEALELAQFDAQCAIQGTEVLVRDGSDVGFIILTENQDNIQIHTLCVSPEFQGHGVGTAVVHAVIARAHRSGRNLILSVLKSNVRADALYKRLGFSVVAESVHHQHLRYTGSTVRTTADDPVEDDARR